MHDCRLATSLQGYSLRTNRSDIPFDGSYESAIHQTIPSTHLELDLFRQVERTIAVLSLPHLFSQPAEPVIDIEILEIIAQIFEN